MQNKDFQILLFTNRDSDNLGDKVIEACDISLIQAVMKNLDIENYNIISYDAASVFQSRMEDEISNCDVVIVGGAPMFNYKYQDFYERTVITVEWAKKHKKPVIFSAVGIESYDEDDEKCQRLKKALNEDCVKMITTRDGYEHLKKYKENEKLIISKVSDPAVFTADVFRKFLLEKKTKKKKKIGIFVLRAYGFKANGIDFDRNDSAHLWKGLADELTTRGYDYEFLTSGHYADEAFLDFLIQKYKVPAEKCVVNMNDPEKLVGRIATYDAVVSCRLHPSIISFSLDIPALGVVWNPKVEGFYESIGYGSRAIKTDEISPSVLVNKLEKAMREGVEKNHEYLVSVYQMLFKAIQDVICMDNKREAYNFNELTEIIPAYQGTDETEREENLNRKLRRIYKKYNNIYQEYKVIYNSGKKTDKIKVHYNETEGEIKWLDTGTVEFWEEKFHKNNGKGHMTENQFIYPEHMFAGWNMRVKKNDGRWFWYLEDGSIILAEKYNGDMNQPKKKLIADKATIPFIPMKNFERVVAEAVWKKSPKFKIRYHCGVKPKTGEEKSSIIKYKYKKKEGEVSLLPSFAYELESRDSHTNGAIGNFIKNRYIYKGHKFTGWRMRVRVGQQWYWYLNDGSMIQKEEYHKSKKKASIKIFKDKDQIPYIPSFQIDAVVMEAIWEEA